MKSGTPELVINTGPVIALVAATGGLEWLAELYQTVWLPEAVDSELSAGGPGAPEPSRVQAAAKVVRILPQSGELPAELARQLDPGEAWVIQSALA
jgi:predicted nucleic acid-binding protein